jgi:hypothetical protein
MSGEVFRPREASGAKMPEGFHGLVEFSLLASEQDPFDPMEKAFHELGRERLAETEHLHGPEWTCACWASPVPLSRGRRGRTRSTISRLSY